MPKPTLDEKRLETLRRQLYGKPSVHKAPSQEKTSTPSEDTYSFNNPPVKSPVLQNSYSSLILDTQYLKKDLLKIFALSCLAVAAELALYFGTKSNLINLHF